MKIPLIQKKMKHLIQDSDVTDHSDMLESLILDNPDFLDAEFNDPTSDMEYMDLGR